MSLVSTGVLLLVFFCYLSWFLADWKDIRSFTTNRSVQGSLVYEKKVLKRISIGKSRNYWFFYQNHQGTNLHFLSILSKLSVFSFFKAIFAQTEPLVCLVFVYLKELSRQFLEVFLQPSLFLANLGIFSTPLFWLKPTALCSTLNTGLFSAKSCKTT